MVLIELTELLGSAPRNGQICFHDTYTEKTLKAYSGNPQKHTTKLLMRLLFFDLAVFFLK